MELRQSIVIVSNKADPGFHREHGIRQNGRENALQPCETVSRPGESALQLCETVSRLGESALHCCETVSRLAESALHCYEKVSPRGKSVLQPCDGISADFVRNKNTYFVIISITKHNAYDFFN